MVYEVLLQHIYFYVIVTEKLPIKNKIFTAKIQTEH